MTREGVKAQLAKSPLEWEDNPRLRKGYQSHRARISLIDCDDEEDNLEIEFIVYVREPSRSCSVDISWELGAYNILESSGYLLPLSELKDIAEEHRLNLVCSLLGIKE